MVLNLPVSLARLLNNFWTRVIVQPLSFSELSAVVGIQYPELAPVTSKLIGNTNLTAILCCNHTMSTNHEFISLATFAKLQEYEDAAPTIEAVPSADASVVPVSVYDDACRAAFTGRMLSTRCRLSSSKPYFLFQQH